MYNRSLDNKKDVIDSLMVHYDRDKLISYLACWQNDDIEDALNQIESDEDGCGEEEEEIDEEEEEKKRSEVFEHGKELIEQSNKLLGEIKEMESGKELFQEGKALVDAIMKKQEAKQLMERGMELISQTKQNKEALELMNHCKEFMVFYANEDKVKNILQEGRQLLEDINNEEVAGLWDDSKNVFLDFLSDDSKHLSKDMLDSPELLNLLERGGKLASTVQETIKTNKLVSEFAQKEDFKNILAKGNKFVSEVKSKQQLIDFLKQNKDFIKEIKNTIIPFITDRLLSLQIPTVNGVSKGFKYEISNLVFAGLGIEPEHVNVDFGENNKSITVSVNEFTAQLKNFLWTYKQEGFPYLKDDGTASANFEIETTDSETPEIKITEIVFVLKNLEVIVGKGKAKWLYNYLISKFSDSIKTTVETKIKSTMTTHLNTLTAKINSLVGEYWKKLMTKLNNSTSPSVSSPITQEPKIQEIQDEAGSV
eukprot:gene3652-4195_t